MKITGIDSPGWRHLIQYNASASFGLSVSKEQADLFTRHAEELVRWNRKTNLTAITDPADIAIKHFLDAVIPSKYIPADAKILDIGSGGGFPGLPLKVVEPSRRVTMIDSVRKKISFLSHLIRLMKMDGAEAIHTRAEDLARKEAYREVFDVVICRAFSSVEKFAGLALPFLAPGGMLVLLKGRISSEELAETEAICDRGFTLERIDYELPVADSRRSLLLLGRV